MADRDGLDAGHDVLTLRGNRLQLVGLLVEQQNGERFRADEVDDDLLHDLDDFPEVERGVELVAGDVEVGEVVVLLFDFDVAVGEVFVLFLDFLEPLRDAAVLLGELQHLGAQTLHLFVETGRRLCFQRGQAVPQALVFPK